ncbi:hypothetical protein B0O80DRAFT_497975 [Mortierella sp. GBAus27b]|nr:hypothetical protein B0O80DRAFT_497975 [Mortierella sp. GBAus27b]
MASNRATGILSVGLEIQVPETDIDMDSEQDELRGLLSTLASTLDSPSHKLHPERFYSPLIQTSHHASDFLMEISHLDKSRDVTRPTRMLQYLQPYFKLHPRTHDHTLRYLSEAEWRFLGVRMSRGWANYARHDPELHILMFRRTHDAANEVRLAAAKREEERRRKDKTGPSQQP